LSSCSAASISWSPPARAVPTARSRTTAPSRALGHIHQGLETVAKKENKIEHKEQRAEKKGARAEKKVENLKAKEQQMQTH